MIANIVACGPSGKYWNGKGFSIGVNDCEKWGHKVDNLIVVNSLVSWPERRQIVVDSRPREKLYGLGMWSDHPSYQRIAYTNQWRGRLDRGKLYRSKTSPFIAVTMAYAMGYDKIVLWGVDFLDHPNVKDQKLAREVDNYVSLHSALLKKSANLYLGGTKEFTNEGALKELIPNYIVIE